jgi:hypothetical protein
VIVASTSLGAYTRADWDVVSGSEGRTLFNACDGSERTRLVCEILGRVGGLNTVWYKEPYDEVFMRFERDL